VVVTERPTVLEDSDRTANGLRKRIPRARRADPESVAAPREEPTVELSNSPDEVRACLTTLRDGIQ
jgi:hypothetical protein